MRQCYENLKPNVPVNMTCERCHKDFSIPYFRAYGTDFTVGVHLKTSNTIVCSYGQGYSFIDLCPTCYEEFTNLFKSKYKWRSRCSMCSGFDMNHPTFFNAIMNDYYADTYAICKNCATKFIHWFYRFNDFTSLGDNVSLIAKYFKPFDRHAVVYNAIYDNVKVIDTLYDFTFSYTFTKNSKRESDSEDTEEYVPKLIVTISEVKQPIKESTDMKLHTYSYEFENINEMSPNDLVDNAFSYAQRAYDRLLRNKFYGNFKASV